MEKEFRRCIIIGGGEIPDKKDVDFFIKKFINPVIISADGGLRNAMLLKLKTDYVIGDFDSVSKYYLGKLPKETVIVKIDRQSDTDIEKCIEFAGSRGCLEFLLIGGTGKRIDHTLGNISILLRNSESKKIMMVTPDSVLQVIRGEAVFSAERGERISLFSFNEKTEITTEGLRYPLNGEKLLFGKREGTSNEALGERIVIKADKGELVIVRDLKSIIRNG